MQKIVVDGKPIVPGKVVCVGKNYLAHIREMGGGKPMPEPTIFMKPNSSIVSGKDSVTIPARLGLLHHEVELCFVISQPCKSVSEQDARHAISAWGVGLDFTLRDRQSVAKKSGGPWTISKCFDGAAVFGEFVSKDDSFDPVSQEISLKIGGEVKQSAKTDRMIFSFGEVISFVSAFMTLDVGDVVMTGTPEGVGEVNDGDVIEAEVSSLPPLTVKILRP